MICNKNICEVEREKESEIEKVTENENERKMDEKKSEREFLRETRRRIYKLIRNPMSIIYYNHLPLVFTHIMKYSLDNYGS